MQRNDPELVAARELLKPVRDEYCRTVSTNGMSLSLETSAMFWVLCCRHMPRHVFDGGSGFSSYTVRLWQKTIGIGSIVWTVDDDPEWLQRSKDFCASRGLNVDNFMLWDEIENNDTKYDVMCYDLGRNYFRYHHIEAVFDRCTDNGIIIVDDMHKFNYGKRVREVIEQRNLIGIDVKEATMDSHDNRYAWLVKKQ